MTETESFTPYEPLASKLTDGSLRLSDDQLEFQDSIRSFVSQEMPADYVRNHFEAENYIHDSNLWKQIFSLGLFDYFSSSEESERGGFRELALVASECGRGLFTCDLPNYLFSGPVLAGRLMSSKQLQSIGGEALTTGEKLACYAPGIRGTESVGLKVTKDFASGVVSNLPYSSEMGALFFVPTDRSALYFLDLNSSAEKLEFISRPSLDGTIKRCDLKINKAQCSKIDLELSLVESFYRALQAAEISGACERVVEMTSAFVKERKQFEQPIGTFQAVKHKLADMYLKSEAIKAISSFAAWAADHSPSQLEFSSLLALSYATSEGPLVTEEAVQLHGGIGFSWEFELHLFLRRVRMLAGFSPSLHEVSEDIVRLASRS